MKIDLTLLFHSLSDMPALVQAAETIGFDGLWTAETNSDPFLPLTLAAEHSQRLTLGTGIAVTFPRSPTTLAHLAWDLARYSNGRFILGLGAQVKAHNERRFGVPWQKPITKMRETIEGIRAVWYNWQNGTPLNYEGEFFRLNLMTPFFSTGPLETSPPPIYIAAVNEKMLRLAGSHCDGVHLHPLHTVSYLRDFAQPKLMAGLAQSGRSREAFTCAAGIFVIPTDGPKAAAHYEAYVRQQISFYMSTPAYRVVVEMHGWQEAAFKLSKMARRGQWADMPALISDEMLAEFAVRGPWADLPGLVRAKYNGLLDRVSY
ncbi:MAG: TIGR03617 family F420-dependent LLM class oxidoreductase, partial [Chloroflexota bacterium]